MQTVFGGVTCTVLAVCTDRVPIYTTIVVSFTKGALLLAPDPYGVHNFLILRVIILDFRTTDPLCAHGVARWPDETHPPKKSE